MAIDGLEQLKRFVEDRRDDARYRLHYVRQTVDPLREATGGHRLKIVCLDVNHGDATLLILPTGRVALVDSAKEAWARRRVIPFLKHHNIGEVTYYINTHLHEDHVGQKRRIIREFLVKQVWDYTDFSAGEVRDFEGVQLSILNAFDDAEDENDRSLAFRLELDGFSYTHGADLYADGQQRTIDRFPKWVPTDVYRANHHLHGSILPDYFVQADPVLIVVSAQEAVYQRIAYTRDFTEAVAEIRARGGRLKDICLTLEKGNVVIYANGADDWGYSTYAPNVILAGLYP